MGYRACVFSGEQGADMTLGNMVQQMAMRETPHVAHVRSCVEWFDNRLWIYDVKGRVDRARLVEVFRYARRRWRVDLFVIDSLMKCGLADDDYNGQGDFMEELVTFADAESCHVILVVHPAKAMDESRPVGKLRMKGTGKLSDLAHNCVETWRAKAKERAIAEARIDPKLSEIEKMDKIADLRNRPDTKLIVDKQRLSGKEGVVPLWFTPHARSWSDSRSGELPRFQTVPEEPVDDVAF